MHCFRNFTRHLGFLTVWHGANSALKRNRLSRRRWKQRTRCYAQKLRRPPNAWWVDGRKRLTDFESRWKKGKNSNRFLAKQTFTSKMTSSLKRSLEDVKELSFTPSQNNLPGPNPLRFFFRLQTHPISATSEGGFRDRTGPSACDKAPSDLERPCFPSKRPHLRDAGIVLHPEQALGLSIHRQLD